MPLLKLVNIGVAGTWHFTICRCSSFTEWTGWQNIYYKNDIEGAWQMTIVKYNDSIISRNSCASGKGNKIIDIGWTNIKDLIDEAFNECINIYFLSPVMQQGIIVVILETLQT